ncbi:DUF3307 domain-containing protein [Pseudooceanicola aestuarii]|uniref:DUF3307 domain-containing protein n=1 Tax=Pseudooceanicola aestuarii TaxID=2697319 RepID=UPI0013D3ECCC|nr:DUF3307 domain-containing protein [Pseudooceanicola aestuarii]
MTIEQVLLSMALFQVKHLLADYILQTGDMVAKKGIYGNLVGISHSVIHAVLTIPVLLLVGQPVLVVAVVVLVEFVVHYHIDWAKNQLSGRLRLGTTDREYWFLTGIDQALHQMTYVGILYVLAR